MAYTEIDEMIDEIKEDIQAELGELGEEVPSEDFLRLKAKDAVYETRAERKYPSSYPDEYILADLESLYTIAKAKALYKCATAGAEFQASDNDGGVNRVYVEYEKLSRGVVPIGRIL